jgi:hypothetical protein
MRVRRKHNVLKHVADFTSNTTHWSKLQSHIHNSVLFLQQIFLGLVFVGVVRKKYSKT